MPARYNQVWWVVGLCDRQPGVTHWRIPIPTVQFCARFPIFDLFPPTYPPISFKSQVPSDTRLKPRFTASHPLASHAASLPSETFRTAPNSTSNCRNSSAQQRSYYTHRTRSPRYALPQLGRGSSRAAIRQGPAHHVTSVYLGRRRAVVAEPRTDSLCNRAWSRGADVA